MVLECCPVMLPHGRTALSHPPLQLPDQASAHGLPPSCGGEVRYRSLDPTITSLETYTRSLGRNLRTRQAWQSWMSSSLSGPGGDPAHTSLGFEPPLLEHLALGGGKAKELELGNMILNIHVRQKACRSKLRKGVKQEDPRGELVNMSFQNNKTQTTTEKQLDQARLLEGQLLD